MAPRNRENFAGLSNDRNHHAHRRFWPRFRLKATITEGLGGEMPFDCFTGSGKVVFYKAGSFTPFAYDFDINNDGTLQTPLGAIRKMGN